MATESDDQGELEETNDEGGEISTTASQPAEVAELPVEPTASTSTTVRKFRPAWKNSYPWLQYDEDKGIIIIIYPRPFLKRPNLKCRVRHLTNFP